MLAMYAKQPSADPGGFSLQPVGLELGYDEFERLLLGIAYHMYVMKKKHDPFEEFLGETMDYVFKKAGVLLAADVK